MSRDFNSSVTCLGLKELNCKEQKMYKEKSSINFSVSRFHRGKMESDIFNQTKKEPYYKPYIIRKVEDQSKKLKVC